MGKINLKYEDVFFMKLILSICKVWFFCVEIRVISIVIFRVSVLRFNFFIGFNFERYDKIGCIF